MNWNSINFKFNCVLNLLKKTYIKYYHYELIIETCWPCWTYYPVIGIARVGSEYQPTNTIFNLVITLTIIPNYHQWFIWENTPSIIVMSHVNASQWYCRFTPIDSEYFDWLIVTKTHYCIIMNYYHLVYIRWMETFEYS
jgi:hypothetical protein